MRPPSGHCCTCSGLWASLFALTARRRPRRRDSLTRCSPWTHTRQWRGADRGVTSASPEHRHRGTPETELRVSQSDWLAYPSEASPFFIPNKRRLEEAKPVLWIDRSQSQEKPVGPEFPPPSSVQEEMPVAARAGWGCSSPGFGAPLGGRSLTPPALREYVFHGSACATEAR